MLSFSAGVRLRVDHSTGQGRGASPNEWFLCAKWRIFGYFSWGEPHRCHKRSDPHGRCRKRLEGNGSSGRWSGKNHYSAICLPFVRTRDLKWHPAPWILVSAHRLTVSDQNVKLEIHHREQVRANQNLREYRRTLYKIFVCQGQPHALHRVRKRRFEQADGPSVILWKWLYPLFCHADLVLTAKRRTPCVFEVFVYYSWPRPSGVVRRCNEPASYGREILCPDICVKVQELVRKPNLCLELFQGAPEAARGRSRAAPPARSGTA